MIILSVLSCEIFLIKDEEKDKHVYILKEKGLKWKKQKINDLTNKC